MLNVQQQSTLSMNYLYLCHKPMTSAAVYDGSSENMLNLSSLLICKPQMFNVSVKN